MEIAIPPDNDGFILLQCSLCGEFFKLRPIDVEADDVIEIGCPCCGLKSDNYFTDDVVELAMSMAKSIANDMVFNEMKKWERQFNSNLVSFRAGEKPKDEFKDPITTGIEDLEIEKYKCCNREAKVKLIIKICGSYCPYCGVGYDGYK